MDRRRFLVTSVAGWTLWRIAPGCEQVRVSKAGLTLQDCERLRRDVEEWDDMYVEIDRDIVQLRKRQRTPAPEYRCRAASESKE